MGEPYPTETVVLQDGVQIVLRAIRRDDAPLLQAFVLRLSSQTLFWRANTAMKELSEVDARRLASVDYDRHMAIAATREPEGLNDIIGVARYATSGAGENAETEVAIVVEDAYQGRGLGRLLLARLAPYARSHGIHSFVATVSPQNETVLRLIRSTGLPVESHEMAPNERRLRILLDGSAGRV